MYVLKTHVNCAAITNFRSHLTCKDFFVYFFAVIFESCITSYAQTCFSVLSLYCCLVIVINVPKSRENIFSLSCVYFTAMIKTF